LVRILNNDLVPNDAAKVVKVPGIIDLSTLYGDPPPRINPGPFVATPPIGKIDIVIISAITM
jgi:hypothetical protein